MIKKKLLKNHPSLITRHSSLFLIGISVLITSCGVKTSQEVQRINYSLYDKLYNDAEKTALKPVENVIIADKPVLNAPKYIKVYRGSYKDSNGNVIEGGTILLKVDDGEPKTDF
jgi:hypothetical protein